jgi:hypothetical protein
MAAAVTRRTVIQRAAMGGAAILGAGSVLPGPADAEPSGEGDVRHLRLALSLEYLQARFYSQAATAGSIAPPLLAFARVAAGHERTHIATLRALLGAAAGDPPRVDLWQVAADDAAFVYTATRLEDLAVRALNGQAAQLTSRALAETARVASVDARHAAWIRGLAGVTPEHHVRDEGRSADEVAEVLERLGLAPDLLP